MKQKRIVIVDYIGNCDNNGIPTGHVVKTLKESIDMIREVCDIKLYVSKVYKQYLPKEFDFFLFDYNVSLQMGKSMIERLKSRCNKIKSIKTVLKNEQNIWFLNTDIWLFVVLFFYRKKNNQEIFVTNYIDYYRKGSITKNIKNFIYNKASRNIDCVFTTDRNIKLNKHVFIPDYWFEKDKYNKYKKKNKIDEVCICGGINPGKNIVGAVNTFKKNSQKLNILGKFSDEELYNRISENSPNNITIINDRFSDDEYYRNLSKYKFTLLPYKEENYKNRSSGVILEAIFLDNIVIAPNFLLNHVGIHGIGYKDINELDNFNICNITKDTINEIYKKNSELIKEYDFEIIKNKYINILLKKY